MSDDFDPKAFLAKQQQVAAGDATGEFDPKAFLAGKPQPGAPEAPPEVGGGEAFGRGALQGSTFGFGDELAGLAGAPILKLALGRIYGGGVQLTPQAQAEAKAMGLNLPGRKTVPGLVDAYRDVRDTVRARDEAAQEQHPGKYLGGQLVGGIASAKVAPLPTLELGPGAAIGERMLAGAVNAIPAGAAYGAGASKADLTHPSVQAVDQLVGDVEGGAAGAGILGAGGAGVAQGIRNSPTALRSLGLRLAKRVLGGSVSDAAAEQALKEKVIGYFGSSGGAAKRALQLADKLAGPYGSARQRLALQAAEGAQKAAQPSPYGHLADVGAFTSSLAGGLAHGGLKGGLLALPVTAAEHFARTRGPSTLARASYGLGTQLGNLPISLAGAASRLSPQAAQAALAEDILRRRLELAPAVATEGGF